MHFIEAYLRPPPHNTNFALRRTAHPPFPARLTHRRISRRRATLSRLLLIGRRVRFWPRSTSCCSSRGRPSGRDRLAKGLIGGLGGLAVGDVHGEVRRGCGGNQVERGLARQRREAQQLHRCRRRTGNAGGGGLGGTDRGPA